MAVAWDPPQLRLSVQQKDPLHAEAPELHRGRQPRGAAADDRDVHVGCAQAGASQHEAGVRPVSRASRDRIRSVQ